MSTPPGFAQQMARAPCHHFAAMAQENLQQRLETQCLGLVFVQRHHVDAETVLHLGVLEQVVQHHFRVLAAFEFDVHAHAVAIRFIADFGDAL